MESIYIIGHKNPDTDSICSAYCYAKLKNMIDKSYNYIAARCGNLNDQTKYIFNKFNVNPPILLKDVYPKVADCMTKNVIFSHTDDPIYNVMNNINKLKIRLTPILDDNEELKGIVSILEITDFYIGKQEIDVRPTYLFRIDNFKKVLNCEITKIGENKEFYAQIIVGAMPFDRFKEQFDRLNPKNTLLIVGRRVDIIEYAAEKQIPAIIITGLKNKDELKGIDLTNYKGSIIISYHDTAETLRKTIFSVPAKYVMSKNFPVLNPDMYLDQAKGILINENRRGLPVVDENGKLAGILTRSDIIKKFKHKLILMDHNELNQAIDGAETAEIIEIIDHHRLGTIKTTSPIFFYAKPLGSTCSLVYELFEQYSQPIDKTTASLLLSGILSDTVVLKSPTTTKRDIEIAHKLAKLAELNIDEYGKEIFSVTSSFDNMDIEKAILSDFKIYNEFGVSFGIGQIEVVTLDGFEKRKNEIKEGLLKIKNNKNLDWTMLLITDIINGDSLLVTSSFKAAENLLIYQQIEESVFLLKNILSRKKQLLPEILRVLEELSSK
ncbi:putative manganese-dependent inorganic diphosphatase [Deferribacter thermophilus]|uniref:putative manganese-dependent inorganic diphosphatase n=1 Tax=Deferribacter thermophilus TaxID=53573 RepID=UPI003C23050B